MKRGRETARAFFCGSMRLSTSSSVPTMQPFSARPSARRPKSGPVARAILLAALLSVSQGHAAALSPADRAEIDTLLARLAASGCQFKRNGAWHTAEEARAHLARKLEYLADRRAVGSAEQFIERAATRSSVSGQPYLVRCGAAPAVPSGAWLDAELQALRAGAGFGKKTR